MRCRARAIDLVAFVLAALPLAEARGASPLCVPRVGEKLGVRFVEVCAASAAEVLGEDRAEDETLPAFWIAATPVPCSQGSHETVDCPTVTALETSPVGSALRNRSLASAVIEAATAHRLCTLRFGGRLPTPEEREQARHVLGLVSLLVRDGRQTSGQVMFDELPEWVAQRECEATPSNLVPDCRVSISPPILLHPRREGDAILACDAELADFGPEPAAPIGGRCEADADAAVLRPRCAVFVPHAAYPSRFTLACRNATAPPGEAAAHPSADSAPFRCVLPEHALGRLGEPTGQRDPPSAPTP